MEEAIAQGTHISAMEDEAMEVLEKEVTAKVKQNQCRVVLWDGMRTVGSILYCNDTTQILEISCDS